MKFKCRRKYFKKKLENDLDKAAQQEFLREEIEKSIMSLLSDGGELSYTDEGMKCIQNAVLDICVKNNFKFPYESELIEINNKPHFRIKLTDWAELPEFPEYEI